MGARISKRSGSYNLKKQEEKQEKLLSNKLRRSYSVVSLSEANLYGDVFVVTTLNTEDVAVTPPNEESSVATTLNTEDVDVTILSKEAALIKELKERQNASQKKKVSFVSNDKGRVNESKVEESIGTSEIKNERNDGKEIEVETWGEIWKGDFWETKDDYIRKESEEQILVQENSEEQIETKKDEQKEVIQEDSDSSISDDIRIMSANVVNGLKNIQKQLEPICKEYLEVQTNQSKNEITPKINGECNKSKVSAIILSNQEEQIEVPQVNSNCNGDSIIDLNLATNDFLEKENLQAPDEINKNRLTKTISGNSDLSYKSIDNSDVESNVSDIFFDADDYESDEQLEVWEGERIQDKLITNKVTNDVVECVNVQTQNNNFEKTDPDESLRNSINDAQIEVPDEIEQTEEIKESERDVGSTSSLESFEKRDSFEIINNFSVELKDSITVAEPTEEVKENEWEDTSMSSLESMEGFEKRNNFEIINNATNVELKNSALIIEPIEEKDENEQDETSISSLESMEGFENRENFENFSVESKNSITVAENSSSETKECVKVEKVDDNTLHEIDIKFEITEKLAEVENEKNEIEIENYLSIGKVSENQLDESTVKTASVNNEVTKVMQENSENLNLEEVTPENANKSINNESFSNHTLHESSNIIDSSDILLNNSEVKNVPLSKVTVNLGNSEEVVELPLNNNIDEELETIILQINTVIEEINYVEEQINNLTSNVHEGHNISEMYRTLIKLMRNVNTIQYSQFDAKIINIQRVALDKIHLCLKKLQSVQ